MFNRQPQKPITAISLSVAVAMAVVAPLINISSASAQLFPDSRSNQRDELRNNRDEFRNDRRIRSSIVIPTGSVIPLEYEKEKILVTREETIPLTLTVAANIRDRNRNTLIPFGTEVEGQITPAENGSGSQFIAQELVFEDGTRQLINGSSEVISRTETVKRGTDTGDILKGAAIGGAAAAVLGEVFGDINIEEVVGGAALGALGGWLLGRNQVELISIDPNQDLDIILDSDLAFR